MIQAKDLRIGNYFCSEISYMDGGGFSIDKVSELKTYNVVCASTFSEFPYEEIYPIRLTPEILEKCGFSVNIEEYTLGYGQSKCGIFYRDRHGFVLVFVDESFMEHYHTYEDTWYSFQGIVISSLHQLQNLYYARMGKELEVNL